MAHSSSAIGPAHLRANLDILRESRYHQTFTTKPRTASRRPARRHNQADDCRYRLLGQHGIHVRGRVRNRDWPHLEAWAGRLKAMPGFALPYDRIPSKDREFDPV
jgi:hypothetical protein